MSVCRITAAALIGAAIAIGAAAPADACEPWEPSCQIANPNPHGVPGAPGWIYGNWYGPGWYNGQYWPGGTWYG